MEYIVLIQTNMQSQLAHQIHKQTHVRIVSCDCLRLCTDWQM